MPKIGLENSDKYVHFIFYFVLTILLFLNIIVKNNFCKAIFGSILIAVFYGIIIEGIQEALTSTRKAEWRDVLFNSLGSLAAALVLILNRERLNFLK